MSPKRGRGSPGRAGRPALARLFLLAAAATTPAAAAPGPQPAPELTAIARDLGGSDPARLAEALARLAARGKAPDPLLSMLEQRLLGGLPPALALLAVDLLGKQGSATSGPALKLYARHRIPALRRAALAALARAVGAPAEETLRAALLDPSPEARVEAARALASLGVHKALPDLLRGLDRGSSEAGEAFAALCREQECDAVALRTGLWPLAAVAPAIAVVLARPAADVSDAQKRALVVRLRSVASAEAMALLRQLFAGLSPSSSAAVRGALGEALGLPPPAGER